MIRKKRSNCAKDFRGVEQAKERSRDARGVRWLEDLWQDLRYGARMLLKNPAFSITAISILAVGIGANTAIFSVVYAVILVRCPYAESERLVMIKEDWPAKGSPILAFQCPIFSSGGIETESLISSKPSLPTIRHLEYGDPERVKGADVSAELFPFIGVAPVQGRRFLSEEQQFGIIGWSSWCRALAMSLRRSNETQWAGDKNQWRDIQYRRRHAGRI